MREHLITSAAFFQSALYASSRDMTPELAETLLLLSRVFGYVMIYSILRFQT